MGDMWETAETAETASAPLNVAAMTPGETHQSNQLYVLLLLCRQQPLTEVVNSGKCHGMVAWRRLVEVQGPVVRWIVSGQWSFAGDVEARLALLERDILRCGLTSAIMEVRIVLRQLALKQHLLPKGHGLAERAHQDAEER